ncbi:MAG: hypothetical protein KAK00_00330 [Nanoarchaeota archaeon]|nr:hypothetical protein [Nanoarchaeota archaeon]
MSENKSESDKLILLRASSLDSIQDDVVENPKELGNTFNAGAMCVLGLIRRHGILTELPKGVK